MSKPKKVTINLVSQHKDLGQRFLKDAQAANHLPKRFSGFITPRFGDMVFVYQYRDNVLVGVVIIHVNNIENFASKIVKSSRTFDFLTSRRIDEDGESDTASAVRLGGGETSDRGAIAEQESDQ